MRTPFFVAAASTVCVCISSASASSIGVFFESNATRTSACIEQNTPFSFYIFAILDADFPPNGVVGAEYRVTGIDPAWFTHVTPNPSASLVLGSPIDGIGTNIVWPVCQRPATGALLLHTVSGFNPAPPTARTLRVEHRNPPSNPAWPCPGLFSYCDSDDIRLCALGGGAFINRPGDCTVGVDRATWTQIKSLYSH